MPRPITVAALRVSGQVELCAFAVGRLWVALRSGALHVYDTRSAAAAAGVRLVRLGLGRLAALQPCANFSVMVAADRDGNLAVWDTNTSVLAPPGVAVDRGL